MQFKISSAAAHARLGSTKADELVHRAVNPSSDVRHPRALACEAKLAEPPPMPLPLHRRLLLGQRQLILGLGLRAHA